MARVPRSAYAAWIFVCLVWGTTYLAIRIALETFPPFLMASFRWITAGSLLLAILGLWAERLPPPRAWPSLALLGVLLVGVGNGAVVWAQQTVPSGLTAVLVASMPFWMVGTEALARDGERVTVRHAVGLIVGFTGIVLLVWPELRLGSGGGFLGGVVATQVACLGWAVGSSYARRRQRAENVLGAVAFQMLFAGLCLLPLGLVRGEWSRLTFNGRTVAALAYLIVAGSIGGFSAYAYALKHLPVATVSLYAYINPIIAVALGAVLLGESFDRRIALAATIVFAGIALVSRRPASRRPAAH